MAASRAEINLEVSTGFFRISTDNLIYNITVLSGPASGPAGGSAAVPAAPDAAPAAPSCPPPPPPEYTGPGDDYYKQISNDVYNEIGNLAKSLSSTLKDLPAEDRKIERADLDEAGEKIEDAKNQLRDIVSMTEQATMQIMDHVEKVQHQTDDVRDLLAQLKDHKAFLQQQLAHENSGGGVEDAVGVLGEKLNLLADKLGRAEELLAAMEGGEAEQPPAAAAEAANEEPANEPEGPPPAVAAGRRRFLFDLDTVFQTIYELCTNEQVKGHISAAREKAAELFDYNAFVDAISDRVAELAPDDDNFYTVPLTDVLNSLATACSEKKIQNLFVKMEANQGEIFLDSALPLEMPEIEEVGGEGGLAEPAVSAAEQEPPVLASAEAVSAGPEVAPVREVLAEAAAMVGDLREELAALSAGTAGAGMSKEDQLDVFHKIENAFSVASSIYDDVTKITEALSFQDLSGQQILKIIKLLSDFQVQLLAIVVSLGSQLKIKEHNVDITPEESKRLAQEDVDRYLKTMTGDHEVEGPLDQDTVNKMLEEFGF